MRFENFFGHNAEIVDATWKVLIFDNEVHFQESFYQYFQYQKFKFSLWLAMLITWM